MSSETNLSEVEEEFKEEGNSDSESKKEKTMCQSGSSRSASLSQRTSQHFSIQWLVQYNDIIVLIQIERRMNVDI